MQQALNSNIIIENEKLKTVICRYLGSNENIKNRIAQTKQVFNRKNLFSANLSKGKKNSL